MRHDYDLPADWEAMTDGEKDRWFKIERAKRQARSQNTSTARKMKREEERRERRVKARNETREIKE